MEQAFWEDRWDNGRIGFHEARPNPYLSRYVERLQPRAGDGCILVPLCGKTNDLMFLARHGFSVVGVEFVEQAVREFFRENDLLFQVFPDGAHQGISPGIAEHITLWHRDYFRMRTDQMQRITAVYDRAALVALPPDMRVRYAAHTTELASPGALMLLVTFDYDQARMPGPPHAVGAAEVERLYGRDWNVESLHSIDTIAHSRRFADAGLDSFVESVWLLRKH